MKRTGGGEDGMSRMTGPTGRARRQERKGWETDLKNDDMETKRKIVIVGLGEVLFDCDEQRTQPQFGGAPANFADHFLKCAELLYGPDAVEVYVVSAIGADAAGRPDEKGATVLEELRLRGLRHVLTYVKDRPTGIVNKRRDASGSNTYDIRPAAWDRIAWSDALGELARKTDVVCYGTLAQRDEDPAACRSRSTVRRFLDEMIASGRETLRVFDVNLRQHFYSPEVIHASFGRCNVLKISDEEVSAFAEALVGERIGGDAGPLCEALLRRYENLKLVILTEGGRGSRIFTREGVSAYAIAERQAVEVVDTVGAGDSFTAAFTAMYAAGGDIRQAQAFASRVAAFVCTCESATPPYPSDAYGRFVEGTRL